MQFRYYEKEKLISWPAVEFHLKPQLSITDSLAPVWEKWGCLTAAVRRSIMKEDDSASLPSDELCPHQPQGGEEGP